MTEAGSPETKINGVGVSQLMNSRVQRTLPKPFQRPSVVIQTGDAPSREWRYVRACDLNEGDTVPGIGLVRILHESFSYGLWTVSVTGVHDTYQVFPGDYQILAFVETSATSK